MADYAADSPTEAGTTVTSNFRTGSASSDTVPGGVTLLVQNTSGASAHNLDLTISALWHGLSPGSAATPGKRRFTLGTSSWTLVKVPAEMADANNRVAVTIDGTPTEVKYFVIGAV